MTACTICRRATDEREPIRHNGCASRLDRNLAQLPALYALMGAVLAPGAVAGGGRVSGNTRTAPLPVRLEPLDLRARGGIATILATWEIDWRKVRGLTAEDRGIGQRDVAAIVWWLRAHLPWAIENYHDIRGFDSIVNAIIYDCRAAAGLLPNVTYIGDCPKLLVDDEPCGVGLYADPYANEIRCPWCRWTWFRPQWMALGKKLRGIEDNKTEACAEDESAEVEDGRLVA